LWADFFFLLTDPPPPVLAPLEFPPNLFSIIALRAASKLESLIFYILIFWRMHNKSLSRKCEISKFSSCKTSHPFLINSGILSRMGEILRLRGELKGHGGWVTAIATTQEDPNMLLTASRDKVTFFVLLCLFSFIFLDHYCLESHKRRR
jgi:hypothetical protein